MPDSPPDPEAVAAAPVLQGFQRRWLRARAHPLRPVVQVGEEGAGPSVLRAVDAALRDHELVKVRLRQPADKRASAEAIASGTGAALCGVVGHTVILYRPSAEAPRIALPTRPD